MTDEVIDIPVEPRERRRLTFNVGGEIYAFRVPKLYGLMDAVAKIQDGAGQGGTAEAAMFGKIEAWLFDALDPEDAGRIRARLRDEDDDLDIEHLVALFQELVKAASKAPSGSRRSG